MIEAAHELNCSFLDVYEKVPIHIVRLALAKRSADNKFRSEMQRLDRSNR